MLQFAAQVKQIQSKNPKKNRKLDAKAFSSSKHTTFTNRAQTMDQAKISA